MKRVIGIGGIFFKAENPKELASWYKTHLGVPIDETYGGYTFNWSDNTERPSNGYTIWSPFNQSTEYLNPGKKDFMFNFIVDDLRTLVDVLESEGISTLGEIEDTDFGLFTWIMDPEGNKVELWEPLKE
jgi:predicted enzyme related to lactoylglutathione lyase